MGEFMNNSLDLCKCFKWGRRIESAGEGGASDS